MSKKLIFDLEQYLQQLVELRAVHSERLKKIDSCKNIRLKRRRGLEGRCYYYAVKKGEEKQKYIGHDRSEAVNEIKEQRYLNKSLSIIDENIKATQNAIRHIMPTDYESINQMLPIIYQNAILKTEASTNNAERWKERAKSLKSAANMYRTEDLKVMTDDGNFVRSKSEALIYNYLLSMGVTFAYELPLRLHNKTIIPDFTVLSEIDYETEIMIEHQGMMDIEAYRVRFADKVRSYIREGFVPGVDVFFTFDSKDGGFDKTPIEQIIKSHIRPPKHSFKNNQ